MAINKYHKKLLEDALEVPKYEYGKPIQQVTDDKWKSESQYDNYNVNTDFEAEIQKPENAANFPLKSVLERARNEKIRLGYGGKYEPTYRYNYNPSENKAKAEEMREKLATYDKFDYDPTEDAAYKALTKVYHNNAKAASENALARAMAANGGRLSSNAIIAANLGYQEKMAGLEAEIPQLRQAAYNMYRDDKNDIRQLAYDYDNAENTNYSRWTDDYNRLYAGTWDYLNKESQDKQTEFNNTRIKLNDAMTLSQNLGYVTDELSAMTGVPAGTPFESAKQFLTNAQMTVQSDKGEYGQPFLDSIGLNYIKAGPTLASRQLDETKRNNTLDYQASVGYSNWWDGDSYGDDVVGNPDEVVEPGTGRVDALYNSIINNPEYTTSDNIISVIEAMAKIYGLTEEEQEELLTRVGL